MGGLKLNQNTPISVGVFLLAKVLWYILHRSVGIAPNHSDVASEGTGLKSFWVLFTR